MNPLGLEDPPRGGHGNPLQHSCLENPVDTSLAGCGPQGHKEWDMTKVTLAHKLQIKYIIM